jgi:uncharacterized protein (DUF2147 family)
MKNIRISQSLSQLFIRGSAYLKVALWILVAFVSFMAYAQSNSDDILGTWYNAEKTSKIRIYKCGDGNKKYCGKIVWLAKDKEDDGGPRVDKNNPDPKKRKDPMMDMVILKLFVYDKSDKEWEDGTIYDPKNGKTYSCIIKREGKTLKVRGYVGVSMVGRTSTWTLAE